MARIEGSEVQTRVCEVFGLDGPRDIDPKMVFLMVKIIKHCRLRCRSNAALHNWLKKAFPALDITTVKMDSKYPKFPGEKYDALKVFNPAQAGGVPNIDQEEEAGGV